LSAHKELQDGDVAIEVNWAKGNLGGGGGGKNKRGNGNNNGKARMDRGDEQELREKRGEPF